MIRFCNIFMKLCCEPYWRWISICSISRWWWSLPIFFVQNSTVVWTRTHLSFKPMPFVVIFLSVYSLWYSYACHWGCWRLFRFKSKSTEVHSCDSAAYPWLIALWYCRILCVTDITRPNFSKILTIGTFMVVCGIFVSIYSELCSIAVTAIFYVMLRDIASRYQGKWRQFEIIWHG